MLFGGDGAGGFERCAVVVDAWVRLGVGEGEKGGEGGVGDFLGVQSVGSFGFLNLFLSSLSFLWRGEEEFWFSAWDSWYSWCIHLRKSVLSRLGLSC